MRRISLPIAFALIVGAAALGLSRLRSGRPTRGGQKVAEVARGRQASSGAPFWDQFGRNDPRGRLTTLRLFLSSVLVLTVLYGHGQGALGSLASLEVAAG